MEIKGNTKGRSASWRRRLFSRRCGMIFVLLVLSYLLVSLVLYLFIQAQGRDKLITPSISILTKPLEDLMEGPEEHERKEKEAAIRREIDEIVARSNEFKGKKLWEDALRVLDDGLAKYPNSDKLCTFKGGWYFDQANWVEAEKWYMKAHEMNKQEVMYISNVALCLMNQKKEWEAAKWYEKAYDLRPSTSQLLSLETIKWKFNNWSRHEEHIEKILSDIRAEISNGKIPTSINSFVALHMPFTLPELQKIAWASTQNTKRSVMKRSPPTFEHNWRHTDKIRIGWVSYDYRQHAVGVQIKHMFGKHDKSKFKIYAYNANDGKRDNMGGSVTDMIKRDVDVWRDMNQSVIDAARQINDDEIDVLIDLGLFTAYARMDVFVLRPAPIQVAYLGLATTTGAPWMDYILADPVVIPDLDHAQYYTEKVMFLPHSYHVFDHRETYPIKPPPPRVPGKLPMNKFLFCNHANNMRLHPKLFHHMANAVKRSPNSTLVLKYYNEESANNMRFYARQEGLIVDNDPEVSQLVFMPGIGGNDHINAKSVCQVYLDGHYYNGHSTSGDMLYAGVPMVTFAYESMAGRAAASFVTTQGCPEMIANSWEEYEDKAVYFATHPEYYAELRQRIEDARTTHPLYDVARLVKNFERAFTQAYNLFLDGKPPENIYVIED